MNSTKSYTTCQPKPRRVVLRTTDKPKPEPRENLVPIIIEVSADGWIQVYGPAQVRPVIFNRLVASQPEEADLVDEFHELDLPRNYRQFYFPKYLLKTHFIDRRTVDKETRRRERLALHDLYREVAGDAWKKGRKPR